MHQTDPASVTKNRYECPECLEQITTADSLDLCPECGARLQNISVPRE